MNDTLSFQEESHPSESSSDISYYYEERSSDDNISYYDEGEGAGEGDRDMHRDDGDDDDDDDDDVRYISNSNSNSNYMNISNNVNMNIQAIQEVPIDPTASRSRTHTTATGIHMNDIHSQPIEQSDEEISIHNYLQNNRNDTIHNKETQTQLNLLQQKRDSLLSKLHQIKSLQIQTSSSTTQLQSSIRSKLIQYNAASSKRSQRLSDYKCKIKEREFYLAEVEKLDRIHVLQDVFYIFHRGYFATINGLRLGMSAPASLSSSSNASGPPFVSSTTNATANATATATDSNYSGNTSHNNDVPWHEINAGIGMIALLLSTLQSKLHIRSRYTILPRGSTTKVSLNTSNNNKIGNNYFGNANSRGGQDTTSSVGHSNSNNISNQEWDLHYQPTTFPFFARRHWNAALNILGYCLYEVVEDVKQRLEWFSKFTCHRPGNGSGNDGGEMNTNINTNTTTSILNGVERGTTKISNTMDIVIPYDVEISGDWKTERSVGSVKVGGMDIGFQGDGVAWTQALRFVAIDLKWVIAFISKYMDE